MATTSNSGGKILRNRRNPPRTPYSRPLDPVEQPPKVESESENPNWLSGLVISPAKMLVSGASKFLSFFGPDFSASSSDDDDDDEDDDLFENDDDEEIENDVSFEQKDQPNKAFLASEKSDKKSIIEQLVTQETFSRSEENKLIKLIKSRVADTNGTSDENIDNMHSPAIKEVRKWLQQKRSGSKKKEHEFVNQIPVTPFNMKRKYLSSGSWNIMEELRRVRSKTAEKQPVVTPLTKTDLCSISPEVDHPQDYLMNNRVVEGADLESNEVNEVRSRAAEEGFPSTSSGLIAGQVARALKSKQCDAVNGYHLGSIQIAKDIHVEENSNPEPDPTINLSNGTPNDSLINGSQNSSSMHPEDLSRELGQLNVEHTSKEEENTKNAPRHRKSRVYSLRSQKTR